MNKVLILLLASISCCHGDDKMEVDPQYSGVLADMWLEGADVIRILWRDCSKKLMDVKDVIDHKEYFPKFVRCMKRKTLRALDRSLSTDIVPIADGVNLVRFEMVDKSGNVMANDNETSYWSENELDEGEWRTLALHRMAKVLRTHVIKFDLDNESQHPEKSEFRGRRRHQMMTMMMFGIVSIGMVLIPMGFQFLAVLGGKALLLAKMALILASIQGLKKIAASPVNYGFYHSYPPPPIEHFEKRMYANRHQNPWPGLDVTHVKLDRSLMKDNIQPTTWKPDIQKLIKESQSRMYPVYMEPDQEMSPSPTFITAIDAPTPLNDLTTTPGDVQADFSVDLPYNGLRFQSAPAVVSS